MHAKAPEIDVTPYEKALDRDWELALSEGSRYFEEKGAVQDALRKIARRLGDLGIPFAVVGGLASYKHGYRRFIDDVDLLVTPKASRSSMTASKVWGMSRP